MSKDSQLVGCRETIELQHHRWVKRGDVAVPDVARHPGEENVGITAFECAHHRQFWNGMPLPKIFAEKKCINARGVAAHDHILVVVWKNFRLDEVTRAQQIR